MSINFNAIEGLSWPQWLKIPHNKQLFENNPNKARNRYMEEEAELIETMMLHERMRSEAEQKQRDLSQVLREVVTNDSLQATPAGAAGAGGGFSQNIGIGNFAVGTFLGSNALSENAGDNTENNQLNIASDGGYRRFTVGNQGKLK